jgi:tetratricopeptide (TPR) repeat protein
MSTENTPLRRAIRQALYHISHRKEMPPDNLLLHSPLVRMSLEERGLLDTPEERQAAVEVVLRHLVNAYGLEVPEGRKQQEVHKHIFEVLSNLLRGRTPQLDASERSYERYHAQGIRILEERFAREEERRTKKPPDGELSHLVEARRRAAEIGLWMDQHPREMDLFAIAELEEANRIIQHYSYYTEAQRNHERILRALKRAPVNLVTLNYRTFATGKWANCFMNTGRTKQAIQAFMQLTVLSKQLGDETHHIHSIHMLGVMHDLLGESLAALQYLRQALALAPSVREGQHRVAWIQRDLVRALMTQGNMEAIPQYAHKSLAIRDRIGDTQGYMLTLDILARAHIAAGEYKQAHVLLDEAHQISSQIDSRLFRTMIHLSFADMYSGRGNIAGTRAHLDQAEQYITQHGLWHQLKRATRIHTKLTKASLPH